MSVSRKHFKINQQMHKKQRPPFFDISFICSTKISIEFSTQSLTSKLVNRVISSGWKNL